MQRGLQMHTCAVTTAAQGYCWGDDETAQGGHGYYSDSANSQQSPTPIDTSTGLASLASISAGNWRTCAVDTSGNAWCWGGNALLGDGTGNWYASPNRISTSSGVAPGSVISADARGLGTSCVLTSLASGGGTFCWGPGGTIGDGTGNQQASPTAVATTPIPDPPAGAPANLAATSGQGTQVPLTWDTVSGAADYQVRWRVGAGAWTVAASATGTSTNVTGLSAGSTYQSRCVPTTRAGSAPGQQA